MEQVTKRDKSLGKLNRTVADAVDTIVGLGHVKKRFKRDYTIGKATYSCPTCNAKATVVACSGHGDSYAEGVALIESCDSYRVMGEMFREVETVLEMAA